MSEQVIKLSDNAAERIKHIMSKAENSAIGVRVGVKSGGCAGMSYVMEYAKEIKPNEEIIEEILMTHRSFALFFWIERWISFMHFPQHISGFKLMFQRLVL